MEIKDITPANPHYAFVESLFISAFPESERRPVEKQRFNIENKDMFHCYLFIENNETPIGFITIWKFTDFYYAEHLAVDPALRNGGYGSRVMQTLLRELKKPLILEVETPEDEMSKRRIGFYQRQGFEICDTGYVQPPYRKGGESLPMYLMVANKPQQNMLDLQTIKETIYKEVYEVC